MNIFCKQILNFVHKDIDVRYIFKYRQKKIIFINKINLFWEGFNNKDKTRFFKINLMKMFLIKFVAVEFMVCKVMKFNFSMFVFNRLKQSII